MPLFLLPFIAGAKSFFGAVLAFVSKPPGSYIATALAVIIGLWWFGQHYFNKGMERHAVLDAEAAANIKPKQAGVTEKIRIVYVQKEAEIKWRTRTITERVPEYVTAKDDAGCNINRGFVRLHDAAARGELPGSPTGTDAAPSGVALSAAAETITGNYGTAHICAARLKAWQSWYTEQKALADK